jgi:hypothetical protein
LSASRKNNPIDWLLEEDQPAVRHYALSDLLDYPKNDPEVREAYSKIPTKGWASDILKLQKKGGYWESRKTLYRPKYTATNWRALVLSDLGLTSEDSRIRATADLFFEDWLGDGDNVFNDEICIVGNTARMLTRFGYEDDARVRRLFDRIVEDQKEDGGWHCFESDVGSLDCWEGLSALASFPSQKRTRKMKGAIQRGAEFYLEHRLLDDGEERYPPWFRLHYPNHYYYDLLVGLDVITRLGYAGDRRLEPAVKLLVEKTRKDGRWVLDKAHPDSESRYRPNYRMKGEPRPFTLEEPGKPSKWITLTALRVLKRVEVAR